MCVPGAGAAEVPDGCCAMTIRDIKAKLNDGSRKKRDIVSPWAGVPVVSGQAAALRQWLDAASAVGVSTEARPGQPCNPKSSAATPNSGLLWMEPSAP